MDNFLTQWVEENMRYRGNDEPSRLDLIITREPDIIEALKYGSPIGKSDHVLIECLVREGGRNIKNEDYRKEWLNFNKVNFDKLKGRVRRENMKIIFKKYEIELYGLWQHPILWLSNGRIFFSQT